MKLAENRHRCTLAWHAGRRPTSGASFQPSSATRTKSKASLKSSPRVAAVVSFLLLICLHGCGASAPEQANGDNRPDATQQRTPMRTEKDERAATPERKDAVTEEFLINARQLGRARLGMPFGDLKKLFPDATLHIVSVRADKTSDIALRQNGRDFLFVRTREMDETTVDELPQPDDPVRSLMTGDARYATAEGIRVGSSLEDAAKAYGTPELFYQPPTEFAAFDAANVKNLSFHLAGAAEKEPAGVYRMTPDGQQDGWYKSNRAQPGSRIIFIAVVEM